MSILVYSILVVISSSAAHYRRGDYEANSLMERGEPTLLERERPEMVECPVCKIPRSADFWLVYDEKCDLLISNKFYKTCKYGTYLNEVCGKRLDCYRGPNEKCTEHIADDRLGHRCAPGYYCNPHLGACTGIDSKDYNPYSIFIVYPNDVFSGNARTNLTARSLWDRY